jgi:tRNA pseudouridine38-40 synthase
MRNIKLTIEYDGTNFLGWQAQGAGRTVQQTMEKALASVLQENVRLTVAGRTDTGVHALGQVANFCTESKLALMSIKNGGNALLPDDCFIHQATEVPLTFNSRYAAKSKIYRYTILLRPSVHKRHFGWYIKYPLNTDDMQWAAEKILGEHDFRSFCVGKSEKPHYLCSIKNIRWVKKKDELIVSIEGNRFLHNMVRILVGTLVDIGRGKMEKHRILEILHGKDRKLAGQTAPALGLCLVKVKY